MGFIRKHTGIDLTGGGQRRAAETGALRQEAAGREALEFGAEQVAPFRGVGIQASQGVMGATLPGDFQANLPQFTGFDTDPNRVLQNPLFQALRQDQNQQLINQQAALGRGGSGGTADALDRNLLLLGTQFQDRDIAQQQQDLTNRLNIGQQDFSNRLAANQARFGQLFNLTGLGANAAAQQATQGQNIIQGIGNAQAAGLIGASNAAAQQGQNLLSGLQGATLGSQGLAGGLNAGQGFLAALCDVRLKENIEYVETVDGVDVFTWDWTDEAKEIVGDQPPRGPIAQILAESHPENVVFDDELGFYKVVA